MKVGRLGAKRVVGMAVDDSDDAVSARLLAPEWSMALAALPDAWSHAVVTVLCAAPDGGGGLAAVDAALPGRVRGAWGRRLMEAASAEALAGRPCPWQPPCAYNVLFRERPLLKGMEMPKPFVVAVEPGDGPGTLAGTLVVRLTLFGLAAQWVEGAADALVAALRSGLSADEPGRRAPLAPLDRRVEGFDRLALPPVPARVGLAFRTPLHLRREGSSIAEGPALLSSLANRIGAMARWQGVAVEADWRALKEHAYGLEFRADAMAPVQWVRASARQGGRPVPMRGLAGTLWIEGDLSPVWPLLVLGATTHAGSHAALGLGRYELVGG